METRDWLPVDLAGAVRYPAEAGSVESGRPDYPASVRMLVETED
jgi:hypothetical protein